MRTSKMESGHELHQDPHCGCPVATVRVRCNLCGKEVERLMPKCRTWLASFCEAAGKPGRLRRIKSS